MSECPLVACKNDICKVECQYLKKVKLAAAFGMSVEEWDRERAMAEWQNSFTQQSRQDECCPGGCQFTPCRANQQDTSK